jgi:hypothetical protein
MGKTGSWEKQKNGEKQGQGKTGSGLVLAYFVAELSSNIPRFSKGNF